MVSEADPLWELLRAVARDAAAWPKLLAALEPELLVMARRQPIGRLRERDDTPREIVTRVFERLHANDFAAIKRLVALEPSPELRAYLRVIDARRLGRRHARLHAAGAGRRRRGRRARDVYALGAMLYNVLAGHPPYWDSATSKTPTSLVERAAREPPTPLGRLVPRVPLDLLVIVERAMARDLATRYANAGELAGELRRFEAGQLLRSRDYTTGEIFARWVRRNRALAIAAVLAAIVGVLAIVGIARSRHAEHAARGAAEHALADSQLEQARQLVLAGNPRDEEQRAREIDHRRGLRVVEVGLHDRQLGRDDREQARPDEPSDLLRSPGHELGKHKFEPTPAPCVQTKK